MDIRKFFQDCLLVMFLLNIQRGLSIQDDDYEDGPAFGRCPWIRNKLKNGRVRYRYKGRIAKFLCDSGYELAGKRSSTCVRGQWSNPLPVCVARGCSRVPSISNGRVTVMYRGALLVYDCNPGYTLDGDSSIHCDGRRWSASPPFCGVSTPDPETHCDFESPYLCGWTHDLTHDFDWKRNQFATPSGHVGTGPSHDHTFGENRAGYYLYIEASSPRKINDTARLFSPVYPAEESGGCFTFWYHMYGATTGGIRVYLKPESHVFGELSPKWEKFGDQGNQWFRGNIDVPQLNENFQVVIEGIRGESYVGDSAIDDVQLSKLDCESLENATDTATENTIAESCRGRCRGSDTSSSCECNENCIAAKTCCRDYFILCSEGNDTSVQLTDEPLPGDFYGNTTSPVTVTVTSTSLKSTEGQTSTSLSNIPSQSTSLSSKAAPLSTPVPITSSTVTVTSKTAPTLSSTSSVVPTVNVTTSSSRATTSTTKSSTVEDKSRIPVYVQSTKLPNTVPNAESSSSEPSTTLIDVKTTHKVVTSASTKPVQTFSSTKPTIVTSTRSAAKQTTKASQRLTPKVPASTTTSSTTTTTQISTTSTTITSSVSTTTTPSTTPTTTTPSTTSTTTTPSTTSTTTTLLPISTRITISPTSITTTISPTSLITPSTTARTTTINTLPISATQFETSSSSISTTAKSTSVSSSSSIADTTTPRYNLRPRTTTSTSSSTLAFSTTSNYSSATKNSTFVSATTISPPKPETNPTSPIISSTSSTRRRFPFTLISTSTARITTKSSTTVAPPVTSTSTQYTPETSKYPYRKPNPTSMVQTSSYPTTSDTFEMIASKSESPKSNGSSAITISIVVFVIICIFCGVAFYLRKYRNKRQSKLDDDSEMRFLPESDYMDYSEASALDKILIK